jgi:hypothetical protein
VVVPVVLVIIIRRGRIIRSAAATTGVIVISVPVSSLRGIIIPAVVLAVHVIIIRPGRIMGRRLPRPSPAVTVQTA